MRKFYTTSGNKIGAVLSLLVLFIIIVGCGGTKPETPTEATTQGLVKSTLGELTDAIDKGDFSTFRNHASPDFQSTFTLDETKSAFDPLAAKKDLVVPIMRSASGMSAKFTTPPSVREESGNYRLTADGSFPTAKATTKFESEYIWRDNSWKLLKFKINLE